MWVPMRKLLNAGMTLLNDDTVAAGNKLAGSFLGLLKDQISPSIDMDDSVVLNGEADYQGYSRAAVTFTGPFTGQSGWSLIADSANVFQPSGNDTVNTITGQFLVGSDSTSVLAVELFDAPIPLPNAETALVTTPIIGMGPNSAGYGRSIVSN